jgi:hypothetical protein
MSLLGDEPHDLFDLAEKFGKEFGAVVRIVKAAELLGFVQTPGQDVRDHPARQGAHPLVDGRPEAHRPRAADEAEDLRTPGAPDQGPGGPDPEERGARCGSSRRRCPTRSRGPSSARSSAGAGTPKSSAWTSAAMSSAYTRRRGSGPRRLRALPIASRPPGCPGAQRTRAASSDPKPPPEAICRSRNRFDTRLARGCILGCVNHASRETRNCN